MNIDSKVIIVSLQQLPQNGTLSSSTLPIYRHFFGSCGAPKAPKNPPEKGEEREREKAKKSEKREGRFIDDGADGPLTHTTALHRTLQTSHHATYHDRPLVLVPLTVMGAYQRASMTGTPLKEPSYPRRL